MAGLKFYYNTYSEPSRALLMFLKINGVPFEEKFVDLMKEEHKREDYAIKFPTKKVPAIDDNGFYLAESVAIFRYLCTEYASHIAPHWYPADSKQRARVDEYMSWQHTNIRKNVSAVFMVQFLIPLETKSINQEELKKCEAELAKSLDFMDGVFLKDQPYMAGQDISIADLLAICELMQLTYDVTADHPNLTAWIDRVKAKMAPYFDDVHKDISKLKEDIK